MRLALHWRTLGPAVDMDTLLGAASLAGFTGVEARREDVLAFIRRRGGSRLARLFAQHGVSQVATWFGAGLAAPKGEFDAACEAGARLCGALRGLTGFGVGQAVLTVQAPGGDPPGELAAPSAADEPLGRLRRLADLAASVGFQLLLDVDPPEDAAPAVPPDDGSAADLSRLLGWATAAARPNLGLVFDCRRWAGVHPLPPGLAAAPLHVRLADAAAGSGSRLLPGRGDLHLAECLHALHAAGYGGYVSVDVSADGAADPFETARRCRQAAERALAAALHL